jgi:dihydrodipicolinate synthase/N-acetylneuraminate lyase
VRFLKAAMRILGLPGSYTRPPFEVLEGAKAEQLAAAMKGLAIPEWKQL